MKLTPPAELEAVRRGLIGIGLEAKKDRPAEVRLSAAFVRAGLATDMAEGLRMATATNRLLKNPGKGVDALHAVTIVV